jgi:hypothetical protein
LEWAAGKLSQADIDSMKETLEKLEAEVQRAKKLLDGQDFAKAKGVADSVMHLSNEIGRRIRHAT